MDEDWDDDDGYVGGEGGAQPGGEEGGVYGEYVEEEGEFTITTDSRDPDRIFW